jgi:hypothetical protein
LTILDFDAINTDEAMDIFCDGDKCEIVPVAAPQTEEIEFADEAESDTPAEQTVPSPAQTEPITARNEDEKKPISAE